MKKISWGIVGLGSIAHDFVKDLLLLENTLIAAVASRTLDKAEQFAEKYGVKKAYGSYTELFQDPTVDIVYIATPHHAHAELSIEAMDEGKHVLCEKPLAVNAKQVKKVIAAAQRNRVFMMEAFWSRFNPAIRRALALIGQGEIGMVNYINADFSFAIQPSPENRTLNMDLAGGSLMDMGVYPCFLSYVILGKPTQILATGRFHETGADLQTAAIFKYENAIANMMSGFISQSDMVAKIYGTKGRIFLPFIWHEAQGITIVRGNGNEAKSEKIDLPTNGKGFTHEIEECLFCLHNNRLESTLWTHQNSLDLVGITDEIRRQISLKYPFE